MNGEGREGGGPLLPLEAWVGLLPLEAREVLAVVVRGAEEDPPRYMNSTQVLDAAARVGVGPSPARRALRALVTLGGLVKPKGAAGWVPTVRVNGEPLTARARSASASRSEVVGICAEVLEGAEVRAVGSEVVATWGASRLVWTWAGSRWVWGWRLEREGRAEGEGEAREPSEVRAVCLGAKTSEGAEEGSELWAVV